MQQQEQYKISIIKVREKLKSCSKPGVSMILVTSKPQYIDNIYNNLIRNNYMNIEIILILNNNEMKIHDYYHRFNGVSDIKIYKLDEEITLGQCLNFGVEQAKYDYIAKVDDDDFYGENYILDEIDAFKYTEAKVVGKEKVFVYFEGLNILGEKGIKENSYSKYLAGGTLLIKKSVFKEVKFRKVNLSEDLYFLMDCSDRGIKLFSCNRYNYVYMKHKNNIEHTWKVQTSELLDCCKNKFITDDFESYTVI